MNSNAVGICVFFALPLTVARSTASAVEPPSKQSPENLIKQLKDKSVEVRRASIRQLRRLGLPTKSIVPLVRMVRHEKDNPTRVLAIKGLFQIGPKHQGAIARHCGNGYSILFGGDCNFGLHIW